MISWSCISSIIWNNTNTLWNNFIEIWSSSILIMSYMPVSISLIFCLTISIVPESRSTLTIQRIWLVWRIMLLETETLIMISWSSVSSIIGDDTDWFGNNLIKVWSPSILIMTNMPISISLVLSFSVTIVPEGWTTLSVEWIWLMWWIMSLLLFQSNSTCAVKKKCLNYILFHLSFVQ